MWLRHTKRIAGCRITKQELPAWAIGIKMFQKPEEKKQQYMSGRRGRTKILENWPISGAYTDVLGLTVPLFF